MPPFRRKTARSVPSEDEEAWDDEELGEDEEWEEDEDDDEWEEDDEWEDEDESIEGLSAFDEDGDGQITAREFSRTVSFGILAMLPLLVGYELALTEALGAVDPEAPSQVTRSVAEATLSVPLAPLGDELSHMVRRAGLALAALSALVMSFRRGGALVPRLVRTVAEGAVGAVLLGPILAAATSAAEPFVGAMIIGGEAGIPALSRAAFVMGGAAYEELLFRVGVLALAFVIMRYAASWLGFGRRLSSIVGGLLAVGASAALFALFHTDIATSWLGPGGEPFHAALFTWRAISGVILAILVFWRGVGVAAWAHALFNLALLIGVRPPVIF